MEILQLNIFENMMYKHNKLKLDIEMIANNLVCIRNIFKLPNVSNQDAVSIRKRLLRSAINIIKNSNMFQKISVYPKTFYLNSFLLSTSTFLQNL